MEIHLAVEILATILWKSTLLLRYYQWFYGNPPCCWDITNSPNGIYLIVEILAIEDNGTSCVVEILAIENNGTSCVVEILAIQHIGIYLIVEILAIQHIGTYLIVEILANENIGIYLIVVYKLFVSRGRRKRESIFRTCILKNECIFF